jgi:hypothetical protein
MVAGKQGLRETVYAVKLLWVLFITGQILSAGNMNYQQENGYYEINSLYGKHPSRQEIYTIKATECLAVYGLTKAFPKYKEHILVSANTMVWTFIYYDNQRGIALNFRW